jgi:hypothetical protein
VCVRVEGYVGAGLVYGYRSDVLRVILALGVGKAFEDLIKVRATFEEAARK